MRALVLEGNEELLLKKVPIPELKAGQALVKIQAASLNHRDQWCRVGMYPGMQYPSILGSDACVIVEEVADVANKHWVGKEAVINPNINWGDNPEVQSYNFSILGMPSNGVFAEYLAINTDRLHKKPKHLSSHQAAALPLAGLTAYRVCFTKGQIKEDSQVLVTGIGGGVAQFVFLFAKAVGAKVFVTSGNDEKLAKITEVGADLALNYKKEEYLKILRKKAPLGFNTIVDSAGGKDFGELAKMLSMGGRMVVYGTTAGKPSPLHLPRLFFSQGMIMGSTMGNDEEFTQMLAFVEEQKIEPMISSVRPFEEIISAFDEVKAGKQFGKLVIQIA